MSPEMNHPGSTEDDSLYRWYRVWRYDMLEPLFALSGFAEILLKDAKGALAKPITADDRRRFLEIVLHKAKAIRHALDFLDLYLGYREGGPPAQVIWSGESSARILEDVIQELQAEHRLSKAVFHGEDKIPLVRTSKEVLRSALTILLLSLYSPEQTDWGLAVAFERVGEAAVSIEISTRSYRSVWKTLTIDQLYEEPPYYLKVSRGLIEAVDGRLEFFFRDEKLVCSLRLPVWWPPADAARTVCVDLENQQIELQVGQELEIRRVLEQDVPYDLALIEIVQFDRSLIANTSRGLGPENTYRLSFAAIRAGSTVLKLRYSPPTLPQPVAYELLVRVSPQTPGAPSN